MRQLILALTLFLLAASAFGTISDNADGTSNLALTISNDTQTGICAQAWNGTCSGSTSVGDDSRTWVELGVCTQQEADDGDPLPTMVCTSGAVTNGLCDAAWVADAVEIPQWSKCSMYTNWFLTHFMIRRAADGLDKLEPQRAPDPGVNEPVVED